MSQYREFRVVAVVPETSDTKSFLLEPVDGNMFAYRPGQFLTIIFGKKTGDERRSYSISSAPCRNEPLRITVKRVDNGEFSRQMLDYVEVGTTLEAIGPSGFFVIPSEIGDFHSFVFYAAGSGITPILPLIKTILYSTADKHVYLTYSNRSSAIIIFLKEIQELEKEFPRRLEVEWLTSTAQDLRKARLSKYRVEEQLTSGRFSKSKSLFFLCGPHYYMQMISITLLREGVTSDRIRREIFETVKPVVRELPPDTDSHGVTISYKEETFQFEVQYPETILSKAKSLGISIPYSCEAGKCGTCAATCIAGRIWMSYNEVLLDKELREGRVLTCTGYPVGGDVEIEFPG